MLLYIPLDGRGVGLHDREALRQSLQVLETGRPLRLAAERLTQGRGELRRQRGLKAHQGNPALAMLQAHLHAVRGMRIDHHPEFIEDLLDGSETVGVCAAARDECRVSGWKFEFAP